MADKAQAQEARIRVRLDEIKRDFGVGIVELLSEMNHRRLSSKGEITTAPVVEGSTLRWTLSWKEKEKISFDLNLVVGVIDDGKQARVDRVWVQRHASTQLDYEDHTPTTRMRRLTGLSMKEIREAIAAEMG